MYFKHFCATLSLQYGSQGSVLRWNLILSMGHLFTPPFPPSQRGGKRKCQYMIISSMSRRLRDQTESWCMHSRIVPFHIYVSEQQFDTLPLWFFGGMGTKKREGKICHKKVNLQSLAPEDKGAVHCLFIDFTDNPTFPPKLALDIARRGGNINGIKIK